MSSELNDIHNDMASQVFDVTIPLNFLVTEAGQLKVHSSYIGDKCFFSQDMNLLKFLLGICNFATGFAYGLQPENRLEFYIRAWNPEIYTFLQGSK